MRNICMTVSYDGTDYHGFQSQPFGGTVQDELEKAIGKLTGDDVKIHGSGRTDAGVHAYSQVFNFQTSSQIPAVRWAIAMNTLLPNDIVIRDAIEVPLAFHARKSAKRKTYRYAIRLGKHPDVFSRRYEFHHYSPLQLEPMREALACLIGEHDFTSFTSIHSTKTSHVRTVYEAYMEEQDGVVYTYITGNGFLYNMVRVIMGTLIRIGEGKMSANDMPGILAARDRARAGPKAMAHGLTLWDVEYGEITSFT